MAEMLGESKTYALAEMPVRKMANGGESRDILWGTLATGEAIGVHASMQPVGMAPNPQHRIEHSEVICVLEGELEFQRGESKELVGPGGVIYVALGTLHTVRNVGAVPARYVVVAVGGDVKG
ncbi:cupin domain-containing protein [Granulicella sp. dw_53]|uniref:cupin domain-containing protein n=1 Tax=Granulicella sp. dw_53 TaxID=2719792 RepID=UPI001BD68A65|nr:cupin domain-containing protein [Granulicella sp. dw_53]